MAAETGPTVSFVDRNGKPVFLTPDGKLHKGSPSKVALTTKQLDGDIKSVLPDAVKQHLGLIKQKAPQKRF